MDLSNAKAWTNNVDTKVSLFWTFAYTLLVEFMLIKFLVHFENSPNRFQLSTTLKVQIKKICLAQIAER